LKNITFIFETPPDTKPKEKKVGGLACYVPPVRKSGGTRPQCPPPNCTHDHVNSMVLGVGTPFQTNTYSHHTSNFQKEEIKTATQDFRISERKRTASFSDYLRFRLGSRCAHPFVVLQIHQVGILPNSGNLVFLK